MTTTTSSTSRAARAAADTFFRAMYDRRVTFTPSESGTYYARVSGDRNETGSYTLRVTDVTQQQQAVVVPGPPETEPESAQGQSTPGAGERANVSEPDGGDLPNNTTTSGEVDVAGSVTGTVHAFGDQDWVHVELEAGTRYQIDLEGAPTGRGSLYDPWLRGTFGADGNEIPGTRNDDGGVGLNSRLFFTPTATGFYYAAAGGMAYHVGSFTLSVAEAN